MADMDQPQQAFSEALQEMATAETVPIHLLYRLSDMPDEDMVLFKAHWPQIADERRREIIRHLADLSEDDFVVDFQPVFAFCLDDPYSAVRAAGLDGLWDATDLKLIDPIIDRLGNDTAVEVKAAAAAALAHFLLMSAWGELSGVPTDKIYEALMDAYRHPQADLMVRRVSLEALGAVNSPEVTRAIEQAYESPSHELQVSALFAMGNSADPRWLSILLDEMESPYENMRIEAARAAGNIGHSEAISRLAELAYDEDLEVAMAAVAALGEIGGEEAHDVLLEMSEDMELEHIEEAVAEALEEASWSAIDLQFGLFVNDDFDEEE